MAPADDGASPAPIDRSVLARIQSRLASTRLVESADLVADGNLYLRIVLSGDYYPGEVAARLEIRWYRNDDFNVQYQEQRQEETWMCRWDRHPNPHNSRDHFHPPPAASQTDAQDEQWPDDHRDVSQLILEYVENRIEALWKEDT
jgi:hypothetical protein